jgi:hypothetical protein
MYYIKEYSSSWWPASEVGLERMSKCWEVPAFNICKRLAFPDMLSPGRDHSFFQVLGQFFV